MSTPYGEGEDEVLRWEYKVFIVRKFELDEFTADINALGAEGWELVLGTLPSAPHALLFKRPRP